MTEPGDLYTAPIPHCPVHGGPMKPRTGDVGNGYTGTVWVCPGWDGEGCDYEAPPQEWTCIGKTEGAITFTAPLDSPNARIVLGGDP